MLVGWLSLAALATGCGKSAHFDGTEYSDGHVAFRLGPVPSGTEPIDATEALLAFENRRVGTMIAVSARCHRESDDVPLRALVSHLFLQLTDRQTIGERQFQLD